MLYLEKGKQANPKPPNPNKKHNKLIKIGWRYADFNFSSQ